MKQTTDTQHTPVTGISTKCLVQSAVESTPLFTTRDTCVGLAACMGIGLLTSVALSLIILAISASSNVQASDDTNKLLTNKLIISTLYSPEAVISNNCDTRAGTLKNITVGDKLSFLNEANQKQYFRITGIQVVDAKPEILPVVDDTSMLTLVTCYTNNKPNLQKSVSYLVMIEELNAFSSRVSGNTSSHRHIPNI